jgi:hypothetical protein
MCLDSGICGLQSGIALRRGSDILFGHFWVFLLVVFVCLDAGIAGQKSGIEFGRDSDVLFGQCWVFLEVVFDFPMEGLINRPFLFVNLIGTLVLLSPHGKFFI